MPHCLSSVLLAIGLSFVASVAAASPHFSVGEYTRTGDPNYGSLTITDTSRTNFRFRLLALRQFADDPDGGLTRNGEIEEGEAIISGASAVYRSANEEDKELGTCILTFRQSGKAIVVTESGTCWWFGVGVNASGKYRAAETAENTGRR